MKSITEIKGEKTFAGPGAWAYDAEAVVRDTETDSVMYVHVNEYDEFKCYAVSESSLMCDDLTGDGTDAKEPDYFLKTQKELDELVEKVKKEGPPACVDKDGKPAYESPYIEEYHKLSEAKESAYYKVFETLNKVIARLQKGLD